jgi:Tfp pilus assembly major pilin PilA
MQVQHLRHQYLETLGISSWLPRGVLPGAAESMPWVSGFVYSDDDLSEAVETGVTTDTTQNTGKITTSHLEQHSQLASSSAAQVKNLSASLQHPVTTVENISQQAAHLAHEVVTHLPDRTALP